MIQWFWIFRGRYFSRWDLIITSLPTIFILASNLGSISVWSLGSNFVLQSWAIRLLTVSWWILLKGISYTSLSISINICWATQGWILDDASATNCYTSHIFLSNSSLICIASSWNNYLLVYNIVESLLILYVLSLVDQSTVLVGREFWMVHDCTQFRIILWSYKLSCLHRGVYRLISMSSKLCGILNTVWGTRATFSHACVTDLRTLLQ